MDYTTQDLEQVWYLNYTMKGEKAIKVDLMIQSVVWTDLVQILENKNQVLPLPRKKV